MRITAEHVGKKVRHAAWEPKYFVVVEWVKDEHFAGTNADGKGFSTSFAGSTDWELVEEPKRPSERIKEIFHEVRESDEKWEAGKFKSIIAYLDEQHSKGVLK